ncbi:MAG: acyl-CoA dehydrogenase family protein [Chloroflexota bacterium]|nr:acyl-CoA dehydrogenase family protein [Chloroflexota bacterium]
MQPLTDEERSLVELVRQLVRDKIAPRAARYDRDGEFPWDNVRDLNALGLNGVFVPAAFGGAGLSYTCFLRLLQEISQGCASTAVTWAATFYGLGPVINVGTEEQKRRWLPVILQGGLGALAITESGGGSDATGMRTSFRPDGADIVINGSKVFITNGDVADLYLLFGKWTEIPDGRRAISTLVLEKGTPGLIIGKKEDKLGHRASSTVQLSFEDCRVPRANLLGQPGDGLPILHQALNKSRPGVAAQALGIARAAFDDAVGYINERQQFGQRIIDFQGVQFMLADMAAKLAMTEAWMYYVAGLIQADAADYSVEASILKLAASDLAMEVTTNAVQLFGGYGYIKDFRVERLFRDAKITQIWEGTNQLHRALIGRAFIRK